MISWVCIYTVTNGLRKMVFITFFSFSFLWYSLHLNCLHPRIASLATSASPLPSFELPALDGSFLLMWTSMSHCHNSQVTNLGWLLHDIDLFPRSLKTSMTLIRGIAAKSEISSIIENGDACRHLRNQHYCFWDVFRMECFKTRNIYRVTNTLSSSAISNTKDDK